MKGQKNSCEYFNNFANTLKKEREINLPEETYPWLDPSDEQKYMTDQGILDKYIDLENSYLTKDERKEVMGNIIQIQRSI